MQNATRGKIKWPSVDGALPIQPTNHREGEGGRGRVGEAGIKITAVLFLVVQPNRRGRRGGKRAITLDGEIKSYVRGEREGRGGREQGKRKFKRDSRVLSLDRACKRAGSRRLRA